MHSIIAGIANSFTDNLIAEQRYRMILTCLPPPSSAPSAAIYISSPTHYV
ncbi:MAG: hypothetical protein J5902_01590 [Paludibacteraceae bacterium]|nr:hypothetical protein [Paludibacteraceae bacterium]